jgi:hypothetical protein
LIHWLLVSKTRRNNRVIRVERNLKIGTKSRLATALVESKDSETLNTSFVERYSLTLRQGLACLQRRSPAHARCGRRLDEDLASCRHVGIQPGRGSLGRLIDSEWRKHQANRRISTDHTANPPNPPAA